MPGRFGGRAELRVAFTIEPDHDGGRWLTGKQRAAFDGAVVTLQSDASDFRQQASEPERAS